MTDVAEANALRSKGWSIAILIGVVGAGSLMAWSLHTARQEVRKERAAQRAAEGFEHFLLDLIAGDGRGPRAADATIRDLVDRAAWRLEGQPATDPEQLARRAFVLGRLYLDWNELALAEPRLESALAFYEATGERSHRAVHALNTMAQLRLAQARPEEALDLVERGLAMDREIAARDPLVRAGLLDRLAAIRMELGELELAEEALGEALELHSLSRDAHPEAAANVLVRLGLLKRQQRDYAESASLFERALSTTQEQLGDEHERVAMILNNLGIARRRLGDMAAASEAFDRALAIYESTVGPDSLQVANVLVNYGGVLRRFGRLERAEAGYRRALAIYRQHRPPDHPATGALLQNLALLVFDDLGRPSEAESLLQESLQIKRRAHGEKSPNLTTTLLALGRIEAHFGRAVNAEKYLREAIAVQEEGQFPDRSLLVRCYRALAETLVDLGKLDEAGRMERQADGLGAE